MRAVGSESGLGLLASPHLRLWSGILQIAYFGIKHVAELEYMVCQMFTNWQLSTSFM